jgi:hypothetical protein
MNTRLQTQTKAAPTPSFTPVQRGLLQRKCACGWSPGLTGECAECERGKGALQRNANHQSAPCAGFSPSRIPVIQPKLPVGASNDPLERDVDRVAEQVMAAPAHSAVSVAPPRIQRFTMQAIWQVGGTHARRRGPAGLL